MTRGRTGAAVITLSLLSGVIGALGGAAPTTVGWANVLWPLLLCAAVVVSACTASPRSFVWLSALAVTTAVPAGLVAVSVGLAALACSVLAATMVSADRSCDPPEPGPPNLSGLVAALGAGIATPLLLHQARWGFHGASALAGAVAVAPVLLAPTVEAVTLVGATASRWGTRQRRVVAALVATPILIMVAAIGSAAWASREMHTALESARAGDTAAGSEHLKDAAVGFGVAHWLTAGPLAPLRTIPVLSQHVDLLDVATAEGGALSRTGKGVLAAGDYKHLKTSDGRIDLERLRSLVRPTARAEARLMTARRRIDRTSSPWLVGPVRSALRQVVTDLDRARSEADLVGDAARTLPGMLGGDGERIWFVAFLNPAEARGGGGFLGSYAELRADDGRISMTRSGSVIDLIGAAPPGVRTLDGPTDYLARYGRFHPEDFFQDLSFSPHFPYTADVISQLYPQSGGTQLDGVLAVDPYALAALLRLTGPITVEGLDHPLTAENAADEILRHQYVRFEAENGSDQTQRRDVLDSLARATFQRLLTGGLPEPRALVEALGTVVDQRRLQAHARRPDEQALIERAGMDGSMAATGPGDYLMVSHQNYGNSKIDSYLRRTIAYNARVDPATGQTAAVATIVLDNTAPNKGLPGYVIGNNRGAPVGSNLMELSIYSHLAFQGGTIDGAPLAVRPGEEAGARVVTARIVVPPGEQRTVVVRLAGRLQLGRGGYELSVVPQPTPLPDEVSVDVLSSGSAGGDTEVLAHRSRGPLLTPERIGLP